MQRFIIGELPSNADEDSAIRPASPSACVAILAHNEELRIERCISAILLQSHDIPVHVIVNGSSDRTAEIARSITSHNLTVHEYSEGGKSRSWNRFVFETLEEFSDIHIFVDGDAEIAPGSITSLVDSLSNNTHAYIASALPLNGRRSAYYRGLMQANRTMFGDLYAVKGAFLERIKLAKIRLPSDLIGDDGLIAAMAKTDLKTEEFWDDTRVEVCEGAGFFCEPVGITSWRTMRMQYKRMINYSLRYFQNRIISQIMANSGPTGLPQNLKSVYHCHEDLFLVRKSLLVWFFDRIALRRINEAIETNKSRSG